MTVAAGLVLLVEAATVGPGPAACAQYGERQRRTQPEAWRGVELPTAADERIRDAGRRIALARVGVEARADAIVDFIFSDADGLRFTYRARPTLSATEAMEQRTGNCLSLVSLFIALGRAADLEAFPVEVEDFVTFSRTGPTVVRSGHVVGGLVVGTRMWTFDFLPGQQKRYRQVRRISDTAYAALFFNATAVDSMLAGDLEAAEARFGRALALDPKRADFWSNYALLARRQDRPDAAIERLERALAIDPDNLPALDNLAAAHRAAGRVELAGPLEARALALEHQNPYFLLAEAERRIESLQLDEAETLLKQARRIDGRIPELYLALGRIALQRGEPERAQRLFAEARERSAALSVAFQHGLDDKIDRLLRAAAER